MAIGIVFASLNVWGAVHQKSERDYTILVLGDSLGDGIYAGLHQFLRHDKRFTLIKESKIGSGLYATNIDQWREKLNVLVEKHQPDLAVVWFGGNDPQPLIHDGRKREAFKTEEWRRLYVERVNEYMRSLVENDIATFWIGLPVMRESGYDEDIQYLNEIFRDCAAKNGVTYVITRDLTSNEDGKYSAFGTALDGRKRELRIKDGKHFTLTGYKVVAQRVLEAIQYIMPDFVVEQIPE